LIRARYVHEIDAVLASTVVEHIGTVASVEIARVVATAAQRAVAEGGRDKAAPEQRVAAFDAALEWDDWCGTPWPHRWPPRPKLGFDDLSDPVAQLVIGKALELVRAGGSDLLQKTLGEALVEVGQLRG
jgi:hypothetical protein